MPTDTLEDRLTVASDRRKCRPGTYWWPALAAVLLAIGASASPTAEQLAERRARIARLDSSEQQDLLRKYERFRAMPPEEQQRLRELQAKISADPHADRLHQVLERYHEWLKTITPSERALLAELPPLQRIEEIERIQRNQRTEQHLELLSRRDMREIMTWILALVKEHRDDVLANMSKEERARFEKQDAASQHRWLIYRTFGGRRDHPRGSRITEQDIAQLAEKLSDSARAELDKATTLEAQRRVVGVWILATMHRTDSRQRGRRGNPLVGEELLQFLQNEVPPTDRERLLKMPPDEMLRELREMYFERGHGDGRFRPPAGRRGDEFRGPNRPRGLRSGDAADRPTTETPPSTTPAAADSDTPK